MGLLQRWVERDSNSLCDDVNHLCVGVHDVLQHLQHVAVLQLNEQADLPLQEENRWVSIVSDIPSGSPSEAHHYLLLVAVVVHADRDLFHCDLFACVLLHRLEHLPECSLPELLSHPLYPHQRTRQPLASGANSVKQRERGGARSHISRPLARAAAGCHHHRRCACPRRSAAAPAPRRTWMAAAGHGVYPRRRWERCGTRD